MKTIFIFLAIFCFSQLHGQTAQKTDSTQFANKKPYKAWVETYGASEKSKGYLYDLNDTIFLLQSFDNPKKLIEIDPVLISNISLRKKGRNPFKGLVIGAVAGFSLGAIAGLIEGGDDFPRQETCSFCPQFTTKDKAFGYGMLATLPGTVIGAFVGRAKIRFPIRGERKRYLAQKKKLQGYCLK